MTEIDYTPKEYAFLQIPEGIYKAKIVSADKILTKKNNNCLLIEFEIIKGQYTGATVRNYCNIWGPSPKAKEIAEKNVDGICYALDIAVIDGEKVNTNLFLNKELKIKVKVKNDFSNITKYYKAIEEPVFEKEPEITIPVAPSNSTPPEVDNDVPF